MSEFPGGQQKEILEENALHHNIYNGVKMAANSRNQVSARVVRSCTSKGKMSAARSNEYLYPDLKYLPEIARIADFANLCLTLIPECEEGSLCTQNREDARLPRRAAKKSFGGRMLRTMHIMVPATRTVSAAGARKY